MLKTKIAMTFAVLAASASLGADEADKKRLNNETVKKIVSALSALDTDNGSTGILNSPKSSSITLIADGSVISITSDEGGNASHYLVADHKPVLEVTSACGGVMKDHILLDVKGKVRNGGWTLPTLEPVIYVRPPEDGIYHYTFVATPPDGPSTGNISPIAIDDLRVSFQSKMRGIRIISESNAKELRFVQTVSDKLPEPIDKIEMTSAALDGECLKLGVKYSGGCATHHFELFWSGAYVKSNPPVAVLRLIHDGKDDPCEGYFSKDLDFALPAMDPCILRVEDGVGNSKDVNFKLN